MRIGVDIMGGDNAPDATLKGAILAREALPGEIELVLFGDQVTIKEILTREGKDPGGFSVFHTPETIRMDDHPARVFGQKPGSGIATAMRMLKQGDLDGFASAGNTGALLVGSMQIINSLPGVIRPGIAASVPNEHDHPTILLDVGLNPDCRPDVLYQYAILGSIYCELLFGVKQSRVGLLNIGNEEEKGSLLSRAAYQSMTGTNDFNFIGNVEGNDFFREDVCDVIVCDGFVGNVLIKQMEAMYTMLSRRNIRDDFLEQFNFENHGGTPVLGITRPVIIGHGMSNANAIRTMILHTKDVIETDLVGKIKEIFQ